MINIKGLNKAAVLKALYDGSHTQGMGFLQAVPPGTVTVEHCQMLLNSTVYLVIDAIPHITFKTRYLGEFITKGEADHDILCEPSPASDERLGSSMHRPVRW